VIPQGDSKPIGLYDTAGNHGIPRALIERTAIHTIQSMDGVGRASRDSPLSNGLVGLVNSTHPTDLYGAMEWRLLLDLVPFGDFYTNEIAAECFDLLNLGRAEGSIIDPHIIDLASEVVSG
jgi:hypothetical protein